MKRRDSIKAILVGTVASSVLVDACKSADEKTKPVEQPAASTIDRTKEEAEREAKLMAETFFTTHELATIAVLSDIISPKGAISRSATEAGVPDIIKL